MHERSADGLPVIPPRDPLPQRPADGAVAICGLCGLRVMPVMGYVCSNPRCGVFPVATCSTAAQPRNRAASPQQVEFRRLYADW